MLYYPDIYSSNLNQTKNERSRTNIYVFKSVTSSFSSMYRKEMERIHRCTFGLVRIRGTDHARGNICLFAFVRARLLGLDPA